MQDWKKDPLYPFNIDRRARLSLQGSEDINKGYLKSLLEKSLADLKVSLGKDYHQVAWRFYTLLDAPEVKSTAYSPFIIWKRRGKF